MVEAVRFPDIPLYQGWGRRCAARPTSAISR